MAVPSIASSSPTNGASDAYINVNPTITFDAALDEDTITEDTVQLFDRTSNARVPVTLNYDSDFFKVTVVTDGLLRENTSYRIMLIGDDLKVTISLSGASGGDDLTSSLVIEFSTGDNIYDTDITLVKEADAKTLEGDLFIPSNVKVLDPDFTVSRVRPQNHTADVAVNLTGDRTIKFTFSKDLNISGAISTWAEVESYPILTTGYLGQSGNIQSATAGTFTLPTATLSVTGAVLLVTFDRDFPNNAGVSVNLLNVIEDSDGLDYGGGLEYRITTALYPTVMPPRPIKTELRAVDGEKIYDDYVGSLIHKNTMFLWEKMNRTLDLGDIPYAAWRHIFYSTILDIIEDQDYQKFLTAGTRKQLGDLNVSVDSLIGRLALKIASAQKNKKIALDTLYEGWQVRTAVRSDSAAGELNLNRLWHDINGRYTMPFAKYDQPNIPASNTTLSRRAKTTNPWY